MQLNQMSIKRINSFGSRFLKAKSIKQNKNINAISKFRLIIFLIFQLCSKLRYRRSDIFFVLKISTVFSLQGDIFIYHIACREKHDISLFFVY